MTAAPDAVDPREAVSRAKDALAWTGQPEAAWSIVLEALLSAPMSADRVRERLAAASAAAPALGPPAPVDAVADADLARVRSAFADTPYTEGGPTVRAAVSGGDHAAVVLAAHHGALDGLGLVALLGWVLGAPVTSSVRGVISPPGERWRPAAVARRLREAVFTPPARVRPPRRDRGVRGDRLVAVTGPVLHGGTATLVGAAARGMRAWNQAHGGPTRRPVVAVGVSRRSGAEPTLAHDATWLRLHLDGAADDAAVAAVLARTPAERVGSAPALPRPLAVAVRLLAEQLGSSLLVSNLGVLSGPPELSSVAFFPKQYGRSAVALGAATVAGATTLSLRVRARDFGPDDADRLLTGLVAELRADARSGGHRSAAGLPIVS
jgi:hypothetical protein